MRTPMNPAWVEKARRALLTGQPRLAELYMRRGLNESPESRQRLASYDLSRALRNLAKDLDTIIRRTVADLFGPPTFPGYVYGTDPYPIAGHTGVDFSAPYPTPPGYRSAAFAQFHAEEMLRQSIREPRFFLAGGVA